MEAMITKLKLLQDKNTGLFNYKVRQWISIKHSKRKFVDKFNKKKTTQLNCDNCKSYKYSINLFPKSYNNLMV